MAEAKPTGATSSAAKRICYLDDLFGCHAERVATTYAQDLIASFLRGTAQAFIDKCPRRSGQNAVDVVIRIMGAQALAVVNEIAARSRLVAVKAFEIYGERWCALEGRHFQQLGSFMDPGDGELR